MIFAFLFGLSMDYEVFMLTRMREAYDETGDTRKAIALGLARTGKLVTSAALILMFAFFVLSSSPGVDIKQFGIGLAAGIIFDATVIRALLVPALMRLLGDGTGGCPAGHARSSCSAGQPARVAPRTHRPKSLTSHRRPDSARRLRSSPSRVLRAFGCAGPELFRPAPFLTRRESSATHRNVDPLPCAPKPGRRS